MKVTFILIAGGFSGAENALYNILKFCPKRDRKNISVMVDKDIEKYYIDLEDITLISLGGYFHEPFLIRPYKFLKSILKARNYLKSNKQDVIVKSMIVSLRGTDVYNFIHRYKILNKIFLGNALRESEKIVSVSKKKIKGLSKRYMKKTIVIPNGIDTKFFRPLENIEQRKNVILFTGRFIKMKGVMEILSTAKELPQYEFWFAGQGKLAKLINLPNTKNLGLKSKKELVKLYNQATICVAPSYWEGFSNVGLEVTACKRALIATQEAFSEYITDKKNGILIPAKDEVALKNAIVDLMTNEKKRKEIEKNAREKALKYSWEDVSKKWSTLFKKISKNETNKK
ncbi:glycosyltransferase family 4 protein [Candidatus Pacearchaeota archaeon]|nr:glycosyltransferase family 4 protein [Candidatus Pacearchaeota archaeon]